LGKDITRDTSKKQDKQNWVKDLSFWHGTAPRDWNTAWADWSMTPYQTDSGNSKAVSLSKSLRWQP